MFPSDHLLNVKLKPDFFLGGKDTSIFFKGFRARSSQNRKQTFDMPVRQHTNMVFPKGS